MRLLGDFLRIGSLFTFALLLARCSGSSDADSDGEEGGAAGEGATGGALSGRGGSAGAGRGGRAGSAGTLGGAGSATAGTGGSAGAGGSSVAGNGGQAGEAGSAGGGTAGSTGAAGSAGTGNAGEGGEGGEDAGGGGSGAIGSGGSPDGGGGEDAGGAGAGGGTEQPRLDGDSCSTALPLVDTASGSTSEFTNDQQNASCFTWSLAGPDVAYSFSIPPASRFQVIADPSDTFDLAMYLISPPQENCSALPVCSISADLYIEGRNETLTVDNYGGAWQSYFLMIDGYGAATSRGEYTLTASTTSIPGGDVCETAIPLAVGEPVSATLDGFANDYTGQPVCISANARGADAVYSVTVPAGSTLTLLADPTATMDIVLYAFDVVTAAECRTATTCLAAADVDFGGGNETLTYTNGGTAERTILVHVDRFDLGTVEGGYTLSATLAPVL